jgi:hypothetical protein
MPALRIWIFSGEERVVQFLRRFATDRSLGPKRARQAHSSSSPKAATSRPRHISHVSQEVSRRSYLKRQRISDLAAWLTRIWKDADRW